jgi:hypothetical protein
MQMKSQLFSGDGLKARSNKETVGRTSWMQYC